jgi:hypothetical protein
MIRALGRTPMTSCTPLTVPLRHYRRSRTYTIQASDQCVPLRRATTKRRRLPLSAGCGLVSISGEVLAAGIELSFGGNAKPSGISFLLFARISGEVRSGSN